MAAFVPVIIAGGSGARLWPVSRHALPKPFATLPGRREPLIYDVYSRLNGEPLPPPAAVVSVTAAAYAFLCRTEYERAAGDASASPASSAPHIVIAEPLAKNTAPAIAVAVELICRRFGEDALIAVLPADHAVSDSAAYRCALARALKAAEQGYMALLGFPPTYAATGFGYLELGEALSDDAHVVRRFVEKPPRDQAEAFVNSGNFLWNGGSFCFRAGNGRAQLAQHAADIAAVVPELFADTGADAPAAAADDNALFAPAAEVYDKFPAISFDYAVMEKTAEAAVVAAEGFDWEDVGSWRAIAAHVAADAEGNRASGDALLSECKNTFVAAAGGRLVSALGLSDVYIVDTPDAVLVTSADKSEQVRALFEQLDADGRREAAEPATVLRPWGSYTVLSEGAGYKVKRIEVMPGQRLSLQSHRHRSEHWTCVGGEMGVIIAEREFTLRPDESCHIAAGEKHRMYNNGTVPAVIIEVQHGAHLSEDDITRYEDIYGRA